MSSQGSQYTVSDSLALLLSPCFELHFLGWNPSIHIQKISNFLSLQTSCLGNLPVGFLHWASPPFVSPLSRQYHTGSPKWKMASLCVYWLCVLVTILGQASVSVTYTDLHTLGHTKSSLFRPSWTLLGFITSALSLVNTSGLCSRLGANWRREWRKDKGKEGSSLSSSVSNVTQTCFVKC